MFCKVCTFSEVCREIQEMTDDDLIEIEICIGEKTQWYAMGPTSTMGLVSVFCNN